MRRHLDWLAQAQRDLQKAEADLQHEYWEWACFTAQQAAEKAVKALFFYQGAEAWGHAITPMLRRLQGIPIPENLIPSAQLLDTFYIPTRYPNSFTEGKPADYYNAAKAREAIDAARAIIRFCESILSAS